MASEMSIPQSLGKVLDTTRKRIAETVERPGDYQRPKRNQGYTMMLQTYTSQTNVSTKY